MCMCVCGGGGGAGIMIFEFAGRMPVKPANSHTRGAYSEWLNLHNSLPLATIAVHKNTAATNTLT